MSNQKFGSGIIAGRQAKQQAMNDDAMDAFTYASQKANMTAPRVDMTAIIEVGKFGADDLRKFLKRAGWLTVAALLDGADPAGFTVDQLCGVAFAMGGLGDGLNNKKDNPLAAEPTRELTLTGEDLRLKETRETFFSPQESRVYRARLNLWDLRVALAKHGIEL